jgi:hypothetical protein
MKKSGLVTFGSLFGLLSGGTVLLCLQSAIFHLGSKLPRGYGVRSPYSRVQGANVALSSDTAGGFGAGFAVCRRSLHNVSGIQLTVSLRMNRTAYTRRAGWIGIRVSQGCICIHRRSEACQDRDRPSLALTLMQSAVIAALPSRCVASKGEWRCRCMSGRCTMLSPSSQAYGDAD